MKTVGNKQEIIGWLLTIYLCVSCISALSESNKDLVKDDHLRHSQSKSAFIINNYNIFSYYHFQKCETFSILFIFNFIFNFIYFQFYFQFYLFSILFIFNFIFNSIYFQFYLLSIFFSILKYHKRKKRV